MVERLSLSWLLCSGVQRLLYFTVIQNIFVLLTEIIWFQFYFKKKKEMYVSLATINSVTVAFDRLNFVVCWWRDGMERSHWLWFVVLICNPQTDTLLWQQETIICVGYFLFAYNEISCRISVTGKQAIKTSLLFHECVSFLFKNWNDRSE